MFLDPFILLSFLGGLFLLSFAVAFLFYIYSKDKEYDRQRNKIYQNSDKSIEEAHEKAKRIIDQAVVKAQETLKTTEYIRQDLTQSLEEQIQEVASATINLLRTQSLEFGKQYKTILEQSSNLNLQVLQDEKSARESLQKELEGLKDQMVKSLESESLEFGNQYRQMLSSVLVSFNEKAKLAMEKIESIPENELEDFKKILEKETVASQDVIGKRINEAFEKAQSEIDAYRQAQMKIIEQQTKTITSKVLKEVLGRSLNESDQEKLILEALQQAKSEGFFSH